MRPQSTVKGRGLIVAFLRFGALLRAFIMPYSEGEVNRFTKKAKSPRRRRQWIEVYKSSVSRGLSEGAAIRSANGVVKKQMSKSKGERRRPKSSSRSGGR